MKRKVFIGLLAVMAALCILPKKANAAAAAEVFIGNVCLDDTNPSTDLYGGTASFRTENGTAILTLNNVNDASGAHFSWQHPAFIHVSGDIVIELVGSNSVVGPTAYDSYGIRVVYGGLTIKGPGSLTATSGTSTGLNGLSDGIYATGNLVLESGSLTSIATTAANGSNGIYAGGIQINGGQFSAIGETSATFCTTVLQYPGGRYLWKASDTTVLPANYTDSAVAAYVGSNTYKSLAFAPYYGPQYGVSTVEPDIPKTGDAAAPLLWTGLLALSSMGLAIRAKRKQNG